MERVDIGAIFQIKNEKNLNLANEVVKKMASLSSLERPTLFLFLVEKEELYIQSRDVTERLKVENQYKPNVIFLTVYNEDNWNENAIEWCEKFKAKLMFIWGGKEDSYDEIEKLSELYTEYPNAGLIFGREKSYITKTKHLKEEYCEDFAGHLELLGYKNYNLEINEEN